ncbi:MAG TPA: hypothetical protein VFT09_00855, partial [Ilumatobacteraceae bacterium]|nr:hypothetical protein [Ilumatobacteraceae bacterium]
RRLHDADDADDDEAKEAVAANNVVDGVLLLSLHPPSDAARLAALLAKLDEPPTNPYLEDGDWPPLDGSERAAVAQILREAADTVDAVADVMLSESVLQHAGGNPYRAAAAMDAMSDGATPSDTVDVLEVPDSADVLTHEVLAIVAGPLPASGWNTARPRALAEPRLEAWATAHLGDPGDIVLADAGGRLVTLADGGVCALDLVHAVDVAAFELALRVGIPDLDGAALAVTRDAAWPAAARPIGQVVGLATALRSVLAGAMPLLPDDLVRPSMMPTRDTSGSRDELTARLTGLAAALGAAADAFGSVVAAVPDDGIVDSTATVALVTGQAFAALEPFGIAVHPVAERPLDLSWARDAWSTAQARGLAASALVAQLTALPADATLAQVVDLAQDVVAAVFGDGFLVVPVLGPGTTDPFADAVAAPAFPPPARSAVRRFVRDVATVRPQVSRLSEALLLEQALGRTRHVAVVQLAERGADGPAPGTDRWLAGPLPPEGPWPAASVTHVVVDAVGTIGADVAVAGLSLDSWLEFLPAQPGPKAKPDDPRPGRARTGLAIRCNGASARPPQAILCAVSPDGRRWTTDGLRGVIEQTLDLARARLVTLERLAGEATILPALYERSSSLQGQRFLDFTKLTTVATPYVAMPFVKEVL